MGSGGSVKVQHLYIKGAQTIRTARALLCAIAGGAHSTPSVGLQAMHLTKQAVCAVKLIEKSTSAVAPASVAAPATSASKSKLRVCCRIYPAPSPGGIRIEDNYTIQVTLFGLCRCLSMKHCLTLLHI